MCYIGDTCEFVAKELIRMNVYMRLTRPPPCPPPALHPPSAPAPPALCPGSTRPCLTLPPSPRSWPRHLWLGKYIFANGSKQLGRCLISVVFQFMVTINLVRSVGLVILVGKYAQTRLVKYSVTFMNEHYENEYVSENKKNTI